MLFTHNLAVHLCNCTHLVLYIYIHTQASLHVYRNTGLQKKGPAGSLDIWTFVKIKNQDKRPKNK